MRFDGRKYLHCRWCRGSGCNQCKAEADAEYARQFPDGLTPAFTARLDSPTDMMLLKKHLSADAIKAAVESGVDVTDLPIRAAAEQALLKRQEQA